MKFELYKDVQIKNDIPKYELKKGDIVKPVEYFSENKDIPAGYAVERFNFIGETIGVFPVAEKDLDFLDENLI
jgi:hypothetical protein